MSPETVARLRAMGIELGEGYDLLASSLQKQRDKLAKKELTIKHLSTTEENEVYTVKLEITSKNITAKQATVLLGVAESNTLGIPGSNGQLDGFSKQIALQSTTTVTFIINNAFNNYQDASFIATLTCDGITARTPPFKIAEGLPIGYKPNGCLCKKTSWTADDLRYIVTQLRKLDDIKTQSKYEEEGKFKGNPIYVDSKGKLHHFLNKTDAEKLGYEKYTIQTSFYDRKDDFDGKPLKDRIFFYDSDKDDDNVNYNLNKEFANYETFAKQLNKVFIDYKITKCIQKIHFLAQIYVETDRFKTTYEIKPKSTYSGGKYYRGRGMKQITHDYNYLNYYDERKGKGKNLFKLYMDNRETYYDKKGKVDSYESVVHFKSRTENEFISDDEMEKFDTFVILLSTSIYWACDSAGWYWNKTKLNNFANDDENAIIVVSAKVNNPSASDNPTGAGINGLKERKMYFEYLKQIFDYENCK